MPTSKQHGLPNGHDAGNVRCVFIKATLEAWTTGVIEKSLTFETLARFVIREGRLDDVSAYIDPVFTCVETLLNSVERKNSDVDHAIACLVALSTAALEDLARLSLLLENCQDSDPKRWSIETPAA